MYRFIGRRNVFSGFGLDVPYTDSYKRTGTASVLPKAPDCGSGKGVQQILNDLGYAAGSVDGMFGSNTFNALSRFAADKGVAYQPSTYPTANLCSLLMQAWTTARAAASSVSPPGAGIVAASTQTTPSADVPVPVTQYTASPAGTVGPGGAIVPAGSGSSVGIVQKAKDWWAAATSQKKAMVVGGLGLAVVVLAAMSLKAPVGRPMTANRRRARRNGGRYLTKAQVVRMFREEVLPAVRAQYGRGDRPAESQAWNDFTDGLQKDGQISARQYSQWTNPMPNGRRCRRNGCGCKAPVSVGTMVANGHSGLVTARRRMDHMSDAELKRFAGKLHQAYLAGAGKGDAYRLWLKAIDMLHGRKAMHPNASSGRYIHVSWLPKKHAARHSTIVSWAALAHLHRQLKAAGATKIRAIHTKQSPDTHFTRNAKYSGPKFWLTRSIYKQQMRELLRRHGYDARIASKLIDEGMGPMELERRLANRPGSVGSLEYTHGFTKPGFASKEFARAVKTYGRNPGPPGHMHRITWKYWTGQAGSTQIPEDMLKELVHRLRAKGATDIRVSGDFGESLMVGAIRANKRRSRAKKCSPLKSRVGTCRCTPAAKYRRLGARHASDYAFEQCFMYPIRFHGKGGKIKIELTKKHIRTAAARFAKWKRRYPKTTRGRIGRRIEAAKKRYGIGQR